MINANAAEAIGYQILLAFVSLANKVIRDYEGQKLAVGGTGDNRNLLRAVAEALREKLKCEIEVPDIIGSGGGIKALAAGKIDLAMIARPLNQSEEKLGLACKQFASSPLVFAVHPGVTDVDDLTSGQVAGIYSGKIADWKELGGPAGKIYPVTRETGNPSLKALNRYLPGFKDITEPRAKVVYTTPKTVEALVRYGKTIGFAPLTATSDRGLRILTIDGVYPSAENIMSGKYKLAVPYFIVYKQEPGSLSKAFADFLYSGEGQKIIIETAAVPAN